jgi:hypothetical protein
MVRPPMAVASSGIRSSRSGGHVQHHLGGADGLLGVDEPRRGATGLQRRSRRAAPSAPEVREDPLASVAHVRTTLALPERTSPTTVAATPAARAGDGGVAALASRATTMPSPQLKTRTISSALTAAPLDLEEDLRRLEARHVDDRVEVGRAGSNDVADDPPPVTWAPRAAPRRDRRAAPSPPPRR